MADKPSPQLNDFSNDFMNDGVICLCYRMTFVIQNKFLTEKFGTFTKTPYLCARMSIHKYWTSAYTMKKRPSIFMEEILEYELLDIEWELKYEFDQEPSVLLVKDGSGEPEKEDANNPSIVFDVNGIPMGESTEAVKLRRQMIYDFYEQWKIIHPEKSVYNKSLKSNILIRQESVVEAAAHAAKRYKSTLAVYKLDEVLAEATKVSEDIPKPGNKNQRKLIRMIIMSFEDPAIGRIKLTVGVRNRTLDKIQYGISALPESNTIVPTSERNKSKASHKK